MRNSVLCLLFVVGASGASAQIQAKTGFGNDNVTSQINSSLHELYLRSAATDTARAKQEAAAQAEVEYQRRIFYSKAKHFVELWKKMTKQMNERDAVDVKLARKVSSAFHDLEKSEGWPIRETK